jgi:predicted nucleic acid-binding protein
MIVVDASVLVEVLVDGPHAEPLRSRLAEDLDHVAPQLIDPEVLAVVQREHLAGRVDATAAGLAVADLSDWPGERWPHRVLVRRAWELRHNVRAYDAMYVVLAEALGVPLVTLDRRLARAAAPYCLVDLVNR